MQLLLQIVTTGTDCPSRVWHYRHMAYSGSASERLAYVRERMAECMTAMEYGTGAHIKVVRQRLESYEKLELRLMDEVKAESDGGSMAGLAVIVGPNQ